MRYASFWSRLSAFIIDNLVIGVPIWIFPEVSQNIEFFYFTFIGFGYFVWMNGTYGATVGKMVMGIKILRENGKKINYSEALLREIASILSFAVLLLGYLNVIWDKKKQGWHDKIAHTIVVKA